MDYLKALAAAGGLLIGVAALELVLRWILTGRYTSGDRVARKRHLGFIRQTLLILRRLERTTKREMARISNNISGFIKAPQVTIENHLHFSFHQYSGS